MALPLALQLYSLRETAKDDFPGVLQQVAGMGYKGVEFAGLHGHEPAQVAKMVGDLGMQCVSAHMSLPTAENVDQVVADAKALGISFVVAGGGPADYQDEGSVRAIAEKFATAAELLAPHDLLFGIHNHWWEFDHQVGGECPHDMMMAQCGDAFAQLDVCWAAFGGHDPAAVIERNAGRVHLLHVKDSTLEKTDEGRPATPHVAVGSGKVDIPACVEAAQQAGTRWLIVELDSCATDMAEACRQSAQYMIQNDLAEGSGAGGCCSGCCGQ
ncbi:MAG: sugar phosphate isomerase/epimerase family protein [Candidatus Brocadiia bacterium]